MIIYGSRSSQLAKEHIADKCPNCGTQNCIDIYVFQNYAHIFWIPFFPVSKTGVSQCDHCKQVLKLREMPPSFTAAYQNLKSRTKAPVWMFTGLILIAVLIIFGIISSKQKNEKNARLILAPQTGDIFKVKTKDNQYTLFKVDQIEGDSVFVQISNYETNKTTRLDDLKTKDYSSDNVGFSKNELKEMLKKGEILDIDRK